jgi:hypothetical protein
MDGRWEGLATSYLAVAGKERPIKPQRNLSGRSQRDDDEANSIDTRALDGGYKCILQRGLAIGTDPGKCYTILSLEELTRHS